MESKTLPIQTSLAVPPSPVKYDDKSDDSEAGKKLDVATKEELLELAKKQEKALSRYKTKFSEVQYHHCVTNERVTRLGGNCLYTA